MSPSMYYSHSFIYRILRPLAIGEIVERQMNYADFSVDAPAVADILRFNTAAYRFLTGSDALPYHSSLDWTSESQHVFRDNLRVAARRLLAEDANGQQYVLDYGAFAEKYPDPLGDPALEPLARLFGNCSSNLVENPVWWTRLAAYAYACRWLLNRQGEVIGFAPRQLDIRVMLENTQDLEIAAHSSLYPAILDSTLAEPL
ncbi:MAG TPA: hypothetical protein VJ777_04750 [Mycobacterium sp.]|nr:hypothetical protein [Mycobacterium sp.]